MFKMKKYVFLLLALPLLTGCGSNASEEALGLNEIYEGETFDIEVKDFYLGDFVMNEELNLQFDQYVVADVQMTNNTEETQTANTLLNFEVEDEFARHGVTIDENDKKFSKTLEPKESFDIPLVFAVDEADEYNLYYNESLKSEDEDAQMWTFAGTDLDSKKVELQQEHNELPSTEDSEEDKEVEEE